MTEKPENPFADPEHPVDYNLTGREIKPENIEPKKEPVKPVSTSYEQYIPTDHQIEHLAKDSKFNVYVVSRPKENWSQDDFEFTLVTDTLLDGKLVEKTAEVIEVLMAKDGGSRWIKYDMEGYEGELYFPTPLRQDLNPTNTYKGNEITLEDLLKR